MKVYYRTTFLDKCRENKYKWSCKDVPEFDEVALTKFGLDLLLQAQYHDSDGGYTEFVEFFAPEIDRRLFIRAYFEGHYGGDHDGEMSEYECSDTPFEWQPTCPAHPERDYIFVASLGFRSLPHR